MRTNKVTILIPAHNSLSTIKNTLDSMKLLNWDLIEELIYIDDASNDGGLQFVQDYLKKSKFKYRIIENKTPKGLAKNYNYGIENSKSRYLITMHQDVEVVEKNTIEKTLESFSKVKNCAIVYCKVIHPEYLYQKYSFWMRVHYSRQIGRCGSGGNSGGKFDCIDLDVAKIKFNQKVFTNSGEDAGFFIDLKKNNLNTGYSEVEVVHNHNFSKDYSWKEYIRKENQFNETYGVIFRNYGFRYYNLATILMMLHRPILLSLLLIPYIRYLGILLIFLYVFYYSKKVILLEYKDPRVISIPLINFVILTLGAYWNIAGFIKGKQII